MRLNGLLLLLLALVGGDVRGERRLQDAEHNVMLLTEQEKESLLRHLPPLLQNASCPRFFSCSGLGQKGFGDHLERYVYCAHASRLLGLRASDMVIPSFSSGPTKHAGAAEYGDVAAFLGVRLSNATAASVIAEHPGMTQHILAYHQVIRWHAELLAGNASLPCNAMFTSDISSCKGWCTRKVDNYDALEDVQLILRGGRLRSKCRARGLGFQHDPQGPVQLVFHVRTGDICLFCRTSYFVSVFAQIKAALGDRPVHVTFESQTPLRFRDSAIQEEPLFAGATFAVNASLLATVCDFVTADIVATTGSSFAVFALAWSDPWTPVLFEEHWKAPVWPGHAHYHTANSAVLLLDGAVTSHSPEELTRLLDSVLPRDRDP